MLAGVFFQQLKTALLECNPEEKIRQVNQLCDQLRNGSIAANAELVPIEAIETPGRPDRPELVHPSQVARRNLNTQAGRIALIHAVCHIEFNAINLALDAAYRFRSLPLNYYQDWLQVAAEEAKHFSLLCDRLGDFDRHYGDFCAHNGLWEMAVKTRHSLVERMALVPRVLEARGLDVTPNMIERLKTAGDSETVAILEIILREEVGHVKIGTKWFRFACAQKKIAAGKDIYKSAATIQHHHRQRSTAYQSAPTSRI